MHSDLLSEAKAAPPEAPLLQVRKVSKRFGGVAANQAISFGVPQGARVAVIGPNGSGKSTLLDAIAGQQPCDEGDVVFDGSSLRGLTVAAIARCGLVRTFQHTGVYDGLSSLDNVLASTGRSREPFRALWSRVQRPTRLSALECLDFVGLSSQAGQLAGELSYGQRKLLELAMALMSRPKMLLLDEPTAGVSPALIPELVARLRRSNEELGITVLFVEHDMQVVAALAQEVHCLVRGRLLSSGSPEAVRSDPRVLDAYLGVA